jgi:hypothetical protein
MKRTTFDTDCLCGQHMTVTITFGRPATFTMDKGVHACAAWTATCKTIIKEARKK